MRDLITNYNTKTLHDTAIADGNGNIFDISGLSAVVLQIIKTGAGTTKVNFEVSVDNTNWTAIKGTKIDDGVKTSSTTASGLFHFCIGGLLKFRARISDTVGVISITVLGIGVTVGTNELSTDIGSILGIVAKGQAIMADSLPVVLASNQTDINVDLPNNLLGITAKGQALAANSLPSVLSTEQEAILTALKIALEIIDNVIAGSEAQVDVITSALPAGAATEATLAAASAKLPATLGQKASAASLASVLSTEQETILTALKTALEIIDNVVSGSEAQVDVITSALPTGASTNGKLDEVKALIGEVQALPTENTVLDRLKDLLTGIVLATGSNAIGKLAANSGVDIGDVDVLSSALPTGASTEATLAAQSAKLPATLGQKASAASLAAVLSTEQEAIQTSIKTAVEIIDNMISGSEAQVDVVTSALPTGASTNSKLDEIKALIGEVQASPTENTVLDRLKDLLTGIVLATGSNAIGKLAANSGVDIGDVDVTSIAAGDNNIGNVDIVTLPQASSVPFGTVAIAVTATAQQLPSNVAKQGVIIVANEMNDAANIVYLGFSNLVTNATYFKQLLPGEATPLLPVTNSNVIWVYCVFTGGTRSYNYAVF